MDSASDIAFTDSVKTIQLRKGSRHVYALPENDDLWQTEITPDIADFITEQRSFFLGTSNSNGQPYIQHRGGPPGFLRVIDRHTLAFADYTGNRQYITQGNLEDNPGAFIFLIDYLNRRRVKIWGKAKVVENDPHLTTDLMPDPDEYRARTEQVIIFNVDVWNSNCPQHIPQRLDREDVDELLKQRDTHIAELEKKIFHLQTTQDLNSK